MAKKYYKSQAEDNTGCSGPGLIAILWSRTLGCSGLEIIQEGYELAREEKGRLEG